jgi:hypothetical protein
MFTDVTTTLRQVANTIYDVFIWPGDFLLSLFAARAPAAIEDFGVIADQQSVILPLLLSLLIWLLLGLLVMKVVMVIVGYCQNILRIVGATIRTISFRVSLVVARIKTSLMCGLRRLIPRRSKRNATAIEVAFDDVDLAVLRSTADCGPGITTSAPELADQMNLRPGRVQDSLDKLSKNKMLEHTTGSTDGFENYRLSQSGAYYMAMWRRNEGVT